MRTTASSDSAWRHTQQSMDKHETLPPGRHELDSVNTDLDPIGHGLERVQTMIVWIEEHRATFEALRETDPTGAETELRYLQNATYQAAAYLQRLTELVLAGYVIDPNKQLPRGLSRPEFRRFAEWCLKKLGY